MMLRLVLVAIIFASLVSCEDERDVNVLQELFKKKYMQGGGYVEWKELHDADTIVLNNVCEKYAFKLSSTTKVVAEGKASFRDKYELYDHKGHVEVDTLTCLVKLQGAKGELKGRLKYFLTEGDEPNSAFKFSLIQQTIVLTRKVTGIWQIKKET